MTDGGGWTIDQTTGELTSNAIPLNLQGADITNVKAIMSASGNWRVDEDGLLVVEEVRAKRIGLEDEDTGQMYCVKIKSGTFLHTPGECDTNAVPSSPLPASEPDTASSTP